MKSLFERENLKRGDRIFANGKQEKIFVDYVKGAIEPYILVTSYSNDSFLNGLAFEYDSWGENEVSAKPKQLDGNIHKLEVDAKVLVWDCYSIKKFKRHFSHFDEKGRVVTFAGGCTSWSANAIDSWDDWELYKEIKDIK